MTPTSCDFHRPLKIALVAHDANKRRLCAWASAHLEVLSRHRLCATGTTGQQLADEVGLEVELFRSGPFGGDQQIGARIAEGSIDVLIFLWDPLEAMPHDADIRALLRIATLGNIPVAMNLASADLLITSMAAASTVAHSSARRPPCWRSHAPGREFPMMHGA